MKVAKFLGHGEALSFNPNTLYSTQLIIQKSHSTCTIVQTVQFFSRPVPFCWFKLVLTDKKKTCQDKFLSGLCAFLTRFVSGAWLFTSFNEFRYFFSRKGL